MKTSFLLALSGLGWAVLAQVHIPFTRPTAREHDSRASRRDDKLNVDLYGAKFTYMLNATVGTPPQDVSMILSCGSYVTWVPDGQSSTCKSRRTTSSGSSSSSSSSSSSPSSSSSSTPRYCIWGSYNKSASTTSATDPDGNTFTARYVDGSYASGKRVLDTMSINGVAATDMPIGVASSMDDYIGVLGIGYNDTTRDNYPDRLVAAGAIKTSAYSIWLNDPEAKSGNVLFGAVDTSKFDGNMTRIYASKTTSVWYTFGTYLNTVNGTNSTVDHKVINSTTMPAPVFISPSDSISNLPDSIASQIWEMANATWNPSYKLATVPCSANASNATFSFELSGAGGPVINVPMVDLVISEDIWSTSTWSWDTESATKYCMFGIQNGTLGSGRNYYSTGKEEQGAWNIGSPLLRRTYTAFDLVNRQVAFAPVKFGVSEQKIVSFESYGSKMPQTTFFCGPQDYCYGEGSSRDRGSSSGRGGSGYGGRYYDEGLSPAGVLGVSIGIGMAFLLIMLGVVWWCLRGGRQCCGERTKEPEAEAEAAAASAQPAMAENSAPAAAPAASPVPTATAEPAPTQPSTSPASHEIPPVTSAPNGEGSSRQP